ncbi:MAG: BspA family leucine-rich repeat surface protein [Clostridia bacterium]|nr:BspA family leucine-rich repeat surface protein [Clostridia bacterium]
MIKSLRLMMNIMMFVALVPLVSMLYVFAARGVGVVSEYTISFISPYCFLVDGDEVNLAIKKSVKNNVSSYTSVDDTLEHIIFDVWTDSVYANKLNWDTGSSQNIDATQNANIRVFYVKGEKTAYVLSPNLIASRDCAHMFENFSALKTVDFRNFNSVESVSHENMFSGDSALTNIYNSDNISTNLSTTLANMFYGCTNLSSVDTTDYRTPNVTTMRGMFKNSGITSVDISSFDAQIVTDFTEMFSGCSRLTSFTANSVKMNATCTMQSMFSGCSALTTLDLTGLNTSNVVNMQNMFLNCSSLSSIDLSSFITVNVTNFSGMFSGCSSLTTLDLGTMTTDHATTLESMFSSCGATELNLSKFDTSNVTNMNQMFYSMPNLTTIYVSNLWTIHSVTTATNMFYGTTHIEGGMHTTYDSTKVNAEYAYVDLPDTKGYLTASDEEYKGVYIYDEWDTLMEITYVSTEATYTLPTGAEYDYFKDKSNNTYSPGDPISYESFTAVENIEFTMYVKRYRVSLSNGTNGSYVNRTISYTYKGHSTSVTTSSTSTTSFNCPAEAVVSITVTARNTSYTNPKCTVSPTSVTLSTITQYSEYEFTMPSQTVTITFSASESGGGWCIASGSMVTMADGTQKAVDDISLNDKLKVFNHEAGEWVTTDVNFIEYDGIHTYNVINLRFSDGTLTRIIYEHGFFDLDTNRYEYIHEDDCTDFIGHRFVKLNGDTHEAVTLVDAFITTEDVGCYSIVGKYHLDIYTDNMLSMPGGISGMFNIFDYDENLKFINMEEELAEYGVFTYEDFADYMDEETFNLYPIPHLKVALAKGIITYEMMEYLIWRYT